LRIRHDIIDQIDTAARIDPTEQNEPIENTDANDPTDPTESAEPTDPTERIEPFDAIERNESSEAIDHLELSLPRRTPVILHPDGTWTTSPRGRVPGWRCSRSCRRLDRVFGLTAQPR
jgi:hypothetical protein